MRNETELKIIGGLIGLWGIVRLVTSYTAISSGTTSLLVWATLFVGVILFLGSAGIFLRKPFGFYLSGIGVIGVFIENGYAAVNTNGGAAQVFGIVFISLIGYYLYKRRALLLSEA